MSCLFSPFTHEKLPYTSGLCIRELDKLRLSLDIVHDKAILVEINILESAHSPNFGESATLEVNRRLGCTEATYFSSFFVDFRVSPHEVGHICDMHSNLIVAIG